MLATELDDAAPRLVGGRRAELLVGLVRDGVLARRRLARGERPGRVAGVPRASLVVIASTLGQFGIPEAGLLMIMGIDTFLDMGRSATNVIGNTLATSVVAKWEGALAPEHALGPGDVVPPGMVPGEIPAMGH